MRSLDGLSVLGLIPARGGSKGVLRKNIRALGGSPLIEWSIRAALDSELLATVVVSTEDEEIATAATECGARVPFRRPVELATDETPTLPVIQHALEYLASMGEHFDAVCLLQPTSPFRTAAHIDEAIRVWSQDDTDTVLSVRPMPTEHHPRWALIGNSDGTATWALAHDDLPARRQALDPAYYRDGAIYLTATSTIRSGSLYGKRVRPIQLGVEAAINIDTVDDWHAAEDVAVRLSKR